MKNLFFCFLLCCMAMTTSAQKQQYFSIRIYHYTSADQENQLDDYLQNALLPALHTKAKRKVGVFKPIGNDTAADKKTYVLIPFDKLDEIAGLEQSLLQNKNYVEKGSGFLNAAYDKPVFTRLEQIILKAFSHAPVMTESKLTNPKSERVYELRSYESASEKIYRNKVHMFNEGDEVGLFQNLGFNAVFYGDVIAGSKMPNLMYMTTHANMEARDKNWKAFVDSEHWKKLVGDKFYANNMQHMDILFLRPTEYSDL